MLIRYAAPHMQASREGFGGFILGKIIFFFGIKQSLLYRGDVDRCISVEIRTRRRKWVPNVVNADRTQNNLGVVLWNA
jgi:hypothetical protein